MERLIRFDIAEHNSVAVVVVESNLLPPHPAIVVIPLLPEYPAVRLLNPVIRYGGASLTLATRMIAAVPRSRLHRTGSAADQGDEITRAVDMLMGGV